MLGGYSGGGLVAFEMAQQLEAAGEDIALVGHVRHLPAARSPTATSRSPCAFGGCATIGWATSSSSVMRRIDARRDAEDLRRAEDIAASGGVVPVELRDTYVQHSFMRAADSYILRPWSGRIVLMRAGEPTFEAVDLGPTYGWDEVAAGGVEVIEVSGNHDTLGARLERVHARPPVAIDSRSHAGRAPLTTTRPHGLRSSESQENCARVPLDATEPTFYCQRQRAVREPAGLSEVIALGSIHEQRGPRHIGERGEER